MTRPGLNLPGTYLGGSSVFVHTVPKAGRIGSLSDPGGAVFVIRGPVPRSQPAE
jgi:hypothetical protein